MHYVAKVVKLFPSVHSLCQTTPYDSNGSLKAWQRCIPFAVWQGWAAMVRAHLVPHLPLTHTHTSFPLTRALFQVCGCGLYPDSQRHYAAQRDSWVQCHALIPRICTEHLKMFLFLFFCIVSWFSGQRGTSQIPQRDKTQNPFIHHQVWNREINSVLLSDSARGLKLWTEIWVSSAEIFQNCVLKQVLCIAQFPYKMWNYNFI